MSTISSFISVVEGEHETLTLAIRIGKDRRIPIESRFHILSDMLSKCSAELTSIGVAFSWSNPFSAGYQEEVDFMISRAESMKTTLSVILENYTLYVQV